MGSESAEKDACLSVVAGRDASWVDPKLARGCDALKVLLVEGPCALIELDEAFAIPAVVVYT